MLDFLALGATLGKSSPALAEASISSPIAIGERFVRELEGPRFRKASLMNCGPLRFPSVAGHGTPVAIARSLSSYLGRSYMMFSTSLRLSEVFLRKEHSDQAGALIRVLAKPCRKRHIEVRLSEV